MCTGKWKLDGTVDLGFGFFISRDLGYSAVFFKWGEKAWELLEKILHSELSLLTTPMSLLP